MNNILSQYRRYVHLVLTQKLLFFSVSFLVMTSAIVISYAMPKTYEASTTIFIEQNVINDLVKGIAVTPSMNAKIKNMTATLTSRTLLSEVVKSLDKDLTIKSESDLENYIKDIQKKITVRLNESKGLVVLSFRDADPKFARDFVNTIARTYIEQITSTKREESIDATNFLAKQIETFKKRVETADAAINAFKSEKGLILSNSDVNLRAEINDAENKLVDLSIRRSELQAKLAILTTPRSSAEKSGNPAEAELGRLRKIYTDKHPKVQKALQSLHNSKGKGESRTATGVPTTDEIKLLQAEIETLMNLEDRQRKIIDDNKTLFHELPNVKATLAELISKKEEESQIYTQLVTRYGQSEISKQMELADKAINFRIIDPAILPETPVSPNRVLIILAGIILGIVAGITAVIQIDHHNPTVRSITEIQAMGMPVLAYIPLMSTADEIQARRRKDRLVMAAAGAYFTLILGFLTLEIVRALRASPLISRFVSQLL